MYEFTNINKITICYLSPTFIKFCIDRYSIESGIVYNQVKIKHVLTAFSFYIFECFYKLPSSFYFFFTHFKIN